VALVRERTIPTERPPPVGEVSANCFLDLEPLLFFNQVAPQLTSRGSRGSRGWVDPVPDPLLLRKSGSAGNRSRDLCICSQKLWPLDHRGGLLFLKFISKLYIFITLLLIILRTYSIQYCLIMYHLSDLTHFIDSCVFLTLFNPRLLMPTKFFHKFKILIKQGETLEILVP
jgi:hypothetical protein